MSPYHMALVASLLFGIVAFPWQVTVRLWGPNCFLAITGLFYVVIGGFMAYQSGLPTEPTVRGVGWATITALLYVGAILLSSYAFAMPNVNVPVVASLTAAYPAWTALISVFVLKQKMSWVQVGFLMLVVVGVVGLTLSAKPANQS